jgi:hypothetical protein
METQDENVSVVLQLEEWRNEQSIFPTHQPGNVAGTELKVLNVPMGVSRRSRTLVTRCSQPVLPKVNQWRIPDPLLLPQPGELR